MMRTILMHAAAFLLAGNAVAEAATRTWVAKYGDDQNACTVTAPCKSFQGARDKTAPGGTISVLTPGDYGPISIDRSINITNDGVGEAGMLVPHDPMFTAVGINFFAGPGDVVSLRGLVIDGIDSGDVGILFSQGSALHVQNCVVRNFAGLGFGISMNNGGHGRLFVSDTLVANNHTSSNGSTAAGIAIQPFGASSNADVVLNRIRAENNGTGLEVVGNYAGQGGSARVVLLNSVIAGNAGKGIALPAGPSAGSALLFVSNSSIIENGDAGVQALGQTGTIWLSKTAVTRNATGLGVLGGGQILSYRDNEIDNNLGADGAASGFNTPR